MQSRLNGRPARALAAIGFGLHAEISFIAFLPEPGAAAMLLLPSLAVLRRRPR